MCGRQYSSGFSTSPGWSAPRPEPPIFQGCFQRNLQKKERSSLVCQELDVWSQSGKLTSLFPVFPIFKQRLNHLLYPHIGDLWGLNAVMQMVTLGKVHVAVQTYSGTTVRIIQPWEYGKARRGNFKLYKCKFLGNRHCSSLIKRRKNMQWAINYHIQVIGDLSETEYMSHSDLLPQSLMVHYGQTTGLNSYHFMTYIFRYPKHMA